MLWLTVVSLIISLLSIFFTYLYRKTKYFEKRGIQYESPEILFGNMRKVYFGMEHMLDLTGRIYRKYSNQRYVGAFNFLKPVVVIRDPELIKTITIKDFKYFVDHEEFTDESVDPLSGKNLLSLKGERWKEMRDTLSPAFTSSKMRGMMPLMEGCIKNFMDYVKEKIKHSKNRDIELEMKDLFSRYSNDVIASCGFGLEVNSFRDEFNEFYKMAKKITTVGFAEFLKVALFYISPFLTRWLKLEFSPRDAANYMRSLVKTNMDEREKKGIVRPDMIHLLMLAKQGKLNETKEDEIVSRKYDRSTKTKTEWSEDELVAQVMLFLFGGLETSSTLMGFMAYELAINPEIQHKLYREIFTVLEQNNGKLDYSDLHSMKYLDMVVMETLRLWSPIPSNDRVCIKSSYKLPPQNNTTNAILEMRKGDVVWIPTFPIHRDSNIYPDPEKFDPERFSEENKTKIPQISYLPFGAGPRSCIGSRFALMEAKLLMVHILKEFELYKIEKTQIPMKLKNHFFSMIPEKGFWIGVKQTA